MLGEFLSSVYYGNTGKEYLIALGIFIALFVIFRLFNYFIIKVLQKKFIKNKKRLIINLGVNFLQGIHWFFYIYLALYLASLYIKVPEIIANFRNYILIIFIGFYVGKGLIKAINKIIKKQIKKREKHGLGNISLIKLLGNVGKAIIWIIILLMILSNFGVEITPLIAGLGIGGIAIAFGLQKILGDLFNAFVIYFDKPFEEGDFIIIGNDMGVIKKIGIKSTRIEALGGQELVVSNTDLVNSRINNYKKMQKRRISFEFGIQYDTGFKKIKKAKKITQDIINKMNNVELDRVHFKKYGDSALIFEVVYYVGTSDYNKYMDIQENINLQIYEKFEKAGIKFAFPTRTLYFKDDKNLKFD